MTQQQGYYAQPEEGGVSGALQRQIGPLKTWQWGIAIGGAFLLWRFARGGSSGSSSGNAFVPASTDSSGGAINDGNDTGGLPTVSVNKTVDKVLKYYQTTLTRTTAIWDAHGHKVGQFTTGRTIKLGAKVKINGQWWYPIINMPGKYLGASAVKVIPVYGNQTTTTTTTTTPPTISAMLASPTTTNTAQPYYGTQQLNTTSVGGSSPTIDTQTPISSL